MDFPQYYHSFHGKTVAKFLRGEFGKIDEVSPYLASLAYALDRASVKKEIEDFLENGGYIIANRYATSNMAHQAAKLKTNKEKNEYLKWIFELEYKVHKIPKEDLVIYLYVPWEIGMYLTKNKPVRHYLGGENVDIHEKDLLYRLEVEKMFLQLVKRYKHWIKIDCMENDKLLSKEKIHQKILNVLKNYFTPTR
jgi:dTMP kinase